MVRRKGKGTEPEWFEDNPPSMRKPERRKVPIATVIDMRKDKTPEKEPTPEEWAAWRQMEKDLAKPPFKPVISIDEFRLLMREALAELDAAREKKRSRTKPKRVKSGEK